MRFVWFLWLTVSVGAPALGGPYEFVVEAYRTGVLYDAYETTRQTTCANEFDSAQGYFDDGVEPNPLTLFTRNGLEKWKEQADPWEIMVSEPILLARVGELSAEDWARFAENDQVLTLWYTFTGWVYSTAGLTKAQVSSMQTMSNGGLPALKLIRESGVWRELSGCLQNELVKLGALDIAEPSEPDKLERYKGSVAAIKLVAEKCWVEWNRLLMEFASTAHAERDLQNPAFLRGVHRHYQEKFGHGEQAGKCDA